MNFFLHYFWDKESTIAFLTLTIINISYILLLEIFM
jgi:hypothetical protein